MAETNKFPRKLLNESKETRMKYFSDLTVGHPRLLEMYKELLRAVRQPSAGKLIFVYGPSGVDKTTLRHRLQKRLIEDLLPQLEADRGRIPFVGIELVAPDYGTFNWRIFIGDFF